MKKVYHLGLDRGMVRGARVALLPGDPQRAPYIAEKAAVAYGGWHKTVAVNREFTTCIVKLGKKALSPVILVTSTGIGGPSASIAVDELAQLGLTTLVRVGTTGSIQDYIKTGDCVITSGSVRLDGASTHYAPIEYPAVADHDVISALIEGAIAASVRYHVGVSASSDTFYHGEERKDSFRKYILRRFRGQTKELKNLHVLNYEMESSTVLTLCASMGLKGGCITGVVNRGSVGKVTPRSLKKGTESAVASAVASLKFLL